MNCLPHLCPLLFSTLKLSLGDTEQTLLLQHSIWHEQEHYLPSHMKFSQQFLKWSTQHVGRALTIKALCLCSALHLMMLLETTNKRLESLVVQNILTPFFFLKVLWRASFSSSCKCCVTTHQWPRQILILHLERFNGPIKWIKQGV